MATIILVDDDVLMRDFISIALTRASHKVEAVRTAKEALALAEGSEADLLITDIFMPESDGLELVREVRRRHPGLQILAISGGGQAVGLDYLHAARIFGAHRTLNKPFSPRELTSTVADMLAGCAKGDQGERRSS